MKFETLDELSNPDLSGLEIIPQAKLSGAKTIPRSGG
jgi:hypothetical protein